MGKSKNKKDGRGGARPGAGRKPIGERKGVHVHLCIPGEQLDELRAFMDAHSIPYYRIFMAEALQLMKERYGDASPEQ